MQKRISKISNNLHSGMENISDFFFSRKIRDIFFESSEFCVYEV